jgi:fused signal recognition particle receptor
MEQDILATIRSWSSHAEQFISANPERSLEVGLGLVAALLVALLLLARSARRSRGKIRALKSTIERMAASRVLPEAVPEQQGAPQAQPDEQLAREPQAPTAEPTVVAAAVEESTIARGLQKSRAGFLSRLTSFFGGKPGLDTSMLDDLEEVLILSDVGARCAADLVSEVRAAAEKGATIGAQELRQLLKQGISNHIVPTSPDHRIYRPDQAPLVILVVGVNGVGKTTTVAKLAAKYTQQGKKVLAVAADTFRAAAVEQLAEWSTRVGFTLIRGAEGAKPSAVVFDGVAAAKEGGYDVVLIDTAGRLHTKSNLMQELEGVRNAIRKHIPDAPHETVLVLDGVSGQNALSQAREFNAAVQLTGIVVTKLDGTPKGGIIVAISQELKVPVFYVGVGEKVSDLLVFDRDAFVSALLDDDATASGNGAVSHAA